MDVEIQVADSCSGARPGSSRMRKEGNRPDGGRDHQRGRTYYAASS